jgi:putative zinc finger protein
MKCEVCLELLEEYFDGELGPAESERVNAHLIACAECSERFATLTAEHEMFARYDRAVEVPPFLWTRVAAHTVTETNAARRSGLSSLFAKPLPGVVVVLLLAIVVGVVYLLARPQRGQFEAINPLPIPNQNQLPKSAVQSVSPVIAAQRKPRPRPAPTIDQSDVLSSDLGYLDLDDRDTARHIEQTQNLLRSIKNVPISEGDEEIDVTYDKALSRRLLNENVVLRRDAEMKAKFPTKTLLADLEPFLIDIANLPDRARPEDVRVIKERVQKTEIVAALLDYQDRGTNNR